MWNGVYNRLAKFLFHVGLFQSAALLINSLLMFLVLWRFQREKMERFRWPKLGYRWIVIGAVISYDLYPIYSGAPMPTKSIGYFLTTALMALAIGLNEELFSRGFIYNLFERRGSWVTFWVSSTSFGALHFLNLFYGHSAVMTLYQAVHALGGGFIFAGLLLYGKTIWIPVIYHALNDFPLLQMESRAGDSMPMDWGLLGNISMDALFALIIGASLHYFATDRREELKALLLRFKLVEVES